MKLKLVVPVLVVATVASLIGSASAASLVGYEGNVRWKPFLGHTGVCRNMWKQYVAASGHSAYASTTADRRTVEAAICGTSINFGSKRAAESQALAQCNAGLKHYKMTVVRNCKIAASK